MNPSAPISREVISRAWVILFILLGLIFVPFSAVITLGLALILSLFGVRSAMMAIGIIYLVRMANPALWGSDGGIETLLGWLVLGTAGLRIFLAAATGPKTGVALPLSLIIFAFVAAVLAVFFSDYVIISIFKLVTYTYGACAIFVGCRILAQRGEDLFSYLLAFWMAVVFGSLLFLAVPAIGYFRDGMGFQGLTNHPQTFAIICAPAMAWAGIHLLLNGKSAGKLVRLFFVVGMMEVFFTRGRTAIAAMGLAWLIGFALSLLGNKRWLHELFLSGMATRSVLILAVLCIMSVAFSGQISGLITQFIFKNISGITLSESFTASRGLILFEQIQNFLNNMWTGIGFGTSRSAIHPFNPVIEPITGLPLGASTEKANIIVALLEEVGIIGAMAFLPFLFVLIFRISHYASLSVACAGLAAITINISETVFFSMGGAGIYQTLILGVATTSALATQRRQL